MHFKRYLTVRTPGLNVFCWIILSNHLSRALRSYLTAFLKRQSRTERFLHELHNVINIPDSWRGRLWYQWRKAVCITTWYLLIMQTYPKQPELQSWSSLAVWSSSEFCLGSLTLTINSLVSPDRVLMQNIASCLQTCPVSRPVIAEC